MKITSFRKFLFALSLGFTLSVTSFAQQGNSRYAMADSLRSLVKMKYVYTLEDALAQSRKTGKPIFFNCFADWALPCHGMNGYVFSNQEFCDWMDKNFVCLYMDVTEPENRHIADKYNIRMFAHFLVLDKDGEIIHRIVGGAQLPEFQDFVKEALSPKTSLRGTEALYKKGKRDKKTLLAYLRALDHADNDTAFKKVMREYIPMLSEKDYSKSENWFLIKHDVKTVQHPVFKYMVEHHDDFVKSVGEKQVNDLMSKVFGEEMLQYLTKKPYNAAEFLDLYTMMQKAELKQDDECYIIYDIIKKYFAHKYTEIFDDLEKLTPNVHYVMDTSLKYPDLTEDEKQALLKYYRSRQETYASRHSSVARFYAERADELERVDGIQFEAGMLGDVLKKAAKENKLAFVDCYTTWCGPCKLLAKNTFPDKELGAYFNQKFVSIQIDMEKGEGPDLQKKYDVSAYPTLLILDKDGNMLHKLMGYRDAQTLLKEVKEFLGEK